MDKLAILGANGFIGTQAVEFFHLQNFYEVVPVVRGNSSLARVARFKLNSQVADANDREKLALAFSGCRYVLHAALGDARSMVNSVEAVYKAAEKAGVEKIVYLSSLAAHGLTPEAGTNESQVLSGKQRFVYNNAKVASEKRLGQLRDGGNVATTILRPGVVYGPRSARWTACLADELIAGTAYLAHNGAGIFNGIYVDNLLEAVRLSLEVRESDRQAFLVSDEEKVTWLEFYERMASALGLDVSTVYRLSDEEVNAGLKPSREDLFNHVRALPFTQSILPLISGPMKSSIKKVLIGNVQGADASGGVSGVTAKVRPTAEILSLQSCRHKVGFEKASRMLGYKPPITFAEGMKRTIAWLEFTGYPIR